MLSNLDHILFPNECEVLEIAPHSEIIYPIFKNGSSTLRSLDHRVLPLAEVKNLKNLTVYVRDPHERFLTGLETYINKLNPALDRVTSLWFANQYLFLNRHIAPQLFWIINLKRFTDATLTLRPMSDLAHLHVTNPSTNTLTKSEVSVNPKLKFYLEMDEVLTVNLINQTVSFEQIFDVLKSNYPDIYQEVFLTAKNILHVVP
jgi:hypothetical protein